MIQQLFAYSLLLLSLPLVASSGAWTKYVTSTSAADGGPPSRGLPGIAPAVTNDGIYIFGGLLQVFEEKVITPLNDLWLFETANQEWTMVVPENDNAPAPRGRVPAVTTDDGRFVIYGGVDYEFDLSSVTMFPDVWAYDPATNIWNELYSGIGEEGEGPGARSGSNMWYRNGKLYVFGGISATFSQFNDLWEFDLETNAWTQLNTTTAGDDTNEPPPVRDAASSHIANDEDDGKVVLYGGLVVGANGFEFLQDVWTLDLVNLEWEKFSTRANTPQFITYAATGRINDTFYIYGGDIPSATSPECDETSDINPQDNFTSLLVVGDNDAPWVTETTTNAEQDNPPALTWVVGTTMNDLLYVFFGWNYDCVISGNQEFNRDVFVYNPSPSIEEENKNEDETSDDEPTSTGNQQYYVLSAVTSALSYLLLGLYFV